jgi:hypothetical protein
MWIAGQLHSRFLPAPMWIAGQLHSRFLALRLLGKGFYITFALSSIALTWQRFLYNLYRDTKGFYLFY